MATRRSRMAPFRVLHRLVKRAAENLEAWSSTADDAARRDGHVRTVAALDAVDRRGPRRTRRGGPSARGCPGCRAPRSPPAACARETVVTAPIDTREARPYNLGDSHEGHRGSGPRPHIRVNAMSSRSANLATRGAPPLAVASPSARDRAVRPARRRRRRRTPRPAPAVDFQRQVRPILADNCFQCHGPDESTRQVRLRLDTEAGAFADRPNGHPIVAGDPQASLIFQRITHADAAAADAAGPHEQDADRRADRCPAALDRRRRFVGPALGVQAGRPSAGAGGGRRGLGPQSPSISSSLEQLEDEGLAPAPEADRRTLARRAALDLTGLPPDPALLESFLNDPADGAYEAFVDRLLATEQWGEHRARYWLDAARYGDTHGIPHRQLPRDVSLP